MKSYQERGNETLRQVQAEMERDWRAFLAPHIPDGFEFIKAEWDDISTDDARVALYYASKTDDLTIEVDATNYVSIVRGDNTNNYIDLAPFEIEDKIGEAIKDAMKL